MRNAIIAAIVALAVASASADAARAPQPVKVQRLTAQVYHLHAQVNRLNARESQLAAMVKADDATVARLDDANDAQAQALYSIEQSLRCATARRAPLARCLVDNGVGL